MRPVRALVVGGRDLIRIGLERVLRADPGIHVLGAASTGAQGLRLTSSLQPDVVIVDHVVADIGALEFCRRVAPVRVVLVSGDLSRTAVGVSLRAGARGLLHLGVADDDLTAAVRAVARGESVLDPVVTVPVLGLLRDKASGRGRALSVREAEALRLVARGLADRRIAAFMDVSPNTVKTYIRRAVTKLGCTTRAEAAAVLARRGLVHGEDRRAGAPPRECRTARREQRRPTGFVYRASGRRGGGRS